MCFIVQLSCKEAPPEPPPHQVSIQLSVEDASCTEAWLKVSLTDASQPRTVAVQQDGQRVVTAQMTTADSVFVVEGLLPRHTYSYVAQRLRDTSVIDVSSPVQARTMDTTSHDFSFQVDTLGEGGSSTLYDVVIINDTLAYAAGEVYMKDSAGTIDPQTYNLMKWNGNIWTPLRIQFYTVCGQTSRTPYPANAVFAFGASDVWIAMRGDQVARWNGNTQTATMCLPVSFTISKLWGENPSSIYAVGAGGNILHYDGSSWARVESRTTLALHDVFGSTDNRTGKKEIICVASNWSFPEGKMLLRLDQGTATQLSDLGLPWSIAAIWHVPCRKYVVVGDGVYQTNTLGSVWAKYSAIPPLYTTSVAGIAVNDVVIGGAFWDLVHFNGRTWRSYFPFAPGSFTAVARGGRAIFAVGGSGDRAIVARGTQ